MMLFVACNKEAILLTSTREQKPVVKDTSTIKADTLTGKEFIFNDLTWTHAGPGGIAEEEIWIGVENRPYLFHDPGRPMEVPVRFDTSSVWTNIPKSNGITTPSAIGFVHLIMYSNSFYVESYPMNFQLIGRKATLKIKFL